jgi:hypothetical protein
MPAILLACASAARAQDVEQILQKTRDTYVALQSYADSGTVIAEYGSGPQPQATRHQFTTRFRRSPRAYVFDFHKEGGDRYVVWGDPDAFHSWWKTTGDQYDFPNPNNLPAISGSSVNTSGAGMKIPSLLYGKSQLAALMLAFADPLLEGVEQIGGHACHRISGRASDRYSATGKEVNVHRVVVWIDAESSLVRQVREEWKGLPGVVNRTTVVYQPEANPTLADNLLTFAAPPR